MSCGIWPRSLPWVLMGFSLIAHGSIPKDEIMGVVVGHIYYFFNDVCRTAAQRLRSHLEPPRFYKASVWCVTLPFRLSE